MIDFELEIIVSSTCNLNCRYCDHFSSVLEPYFLSQKEIIRYCEILKNKNMIPKSFILIGGEPLLNKNISCICEKIYHYFPNIKINIVTNGILLNEDVLSKIDKRVNFSVTPYPIDINYDSLKKKEKREGQISFLSSRFTFGMYTFDKNSQDNKTDKFFNCGKFNLPVLTLYKDKIFYCPVGYGASELDLTQDFLPLEELNADSLKNFCNTPKECCIYCNSKLDGVPWIKDDKKDKNIYFKDLKYFFLHDYDTYYNLSINVEDRIKRFLSYNFLIDKIDMDYNNKVTRKNLVRYFDSKIDIIIPFYRVNDILLNRLEKNLLEQTMIGNCTIYFISDCSPDEEKVFDKFFDHSILNCVLIKNKERKGPGYSRNKGIKCGKGNFLFFLDIDDNINGIDNLEKVYRMAIKKNTDVTFYKTINSLGEKDPHMRALIKRDFIEKNNIYFPDIYIDEDGFFYRKLMSKVKEEQTMNSDIELYLHNIDEIDFNIGSEFHKVIPICSILERYCEILDNDIKNEGSIGDEIFNFKAEYYESDFELIKIYIMCYIYNISIYKDMKDTIFKILSSYSNEAILSVFNLMNKLESLKN